MDIATPNLQVMLHHYSCVEHLFKTITMYADDERERILDEIVMAKSWYWGRYAASERQTYLKKRLFVDARMYEAFSAKYGTPKNTCPVFFYLFPNLSLDTIEERLRQRQQYAELHTKYLLIHIPDLADTTHISFTLSDSHHSYRDAQIQRGFSSDESTNMLADQGNIFHIREIAEVYARNKEEDGLYFEVQVWDTEILEQWRKTHDIP
jgi:hypothetical protein